MKRKAQLSIGFIVTLIIGITLLAIVLVFVTSQFRQGGEALEAASPQERDLAVSSCQSACSRAGIAASGGGADACNNWKNVFCETTVPLGDERVECSTIITCSPPSSDCACDAPDDGSS